MLTNQERRTLSQVSAAEVGELLSALVRRPSCVDETAVAELVAHTLQAEGIVVERQPLGDGRENVVARLGDPGGRRLILASHHDTMPVGEESTWSYPPLEGVLANGRIYGRGASDDKAGVAAMVMAVIALKRAAVPLNGEILLASVGGESVGNLGMRRLVADGLRGDFAIVGEYSEAVKIATTYRGVLWGELELLGTSAHPGRWEKAADAIAAAVDAFVPALRTHAFTYTPHPLVPDPHLHITKLNAGHRVNAVADRCRVTFDVRLAPTQSADQAWDEIARTVETAAANVPGITAALRRDYALDGFETSFSNPNVRVLADAIADCSDVTPEAMGKGGMCDANVLVNEARVPSVVYGPGNPSGVGADEYCDIERLWLATKVYAIAGPRMLNQEPPRVSHPK